MEKKTLFDKIWDAHVVKSVPDGPDVFFIDKHFIHEVTSPVAFLNLEKRGNTVLFPERTVATPDHNDRRSNGKPAARLFIVCHDIVCMGRRIPAGGEFKVRCLRRLYR